MVWIVTYPEWDDPIFFRYAKSAYLFIKDKLIELESCNAFEDEEKDFDDYIYELNHTYEFAQIAGVFYAFNFYAERLEFND